MKFFFALCCFLITAMILPGLAAAEWLTDFEKAKAESLRTGRPIYILFTNSDATFHRSYDQTFFNQRRFQEYADKNLVLMKVDFPVAIHLQSKGLQQQNRQLRTQFKVSVLPTALLLKANGELFDDFLKADGGLEKHRKKINEILKDFDPPKRYADYLDSFVKKYTPPKPEAKEPEAKKQEKKPAKKPDKKPADKQQKTVAETLENDETIIPDENGGTLLIPLDPKGDLQDWLKAGQTEEAAGEVKIDVKESVEEVKVEAENAAGKVQVEVKETVEEITVEAKESVEEKTDALKEDAESQADSAEE